VDVRPSPAAGLAHAVLGSVPAAFAIGVWGDDGLLPEVVAAPVAAALVGLGILVAVRAIRMRVECRNGSVRVRGLLRDRAVPRTSIEDVTDFPALRWRDGAGRLRWTPVTFLMDGPRAFESYRRHNAREIDRLRRWVRAGS
jgi:hypothetical protein